MITVGITGNLNSGKSEAARVFKRLGAEVFDADVLARRAVEKGKPTYRALIKLFGKRFLTRDGQIDRRKLARHVFHHPADLKKLNILIHPGVIVESLAMIERFKKKKGVLAMDVPLLFEAKMDKLADYTVVVRASRARMIDRAAKKGMSRALARRILAMQWPIERKARLADFVVDNNGTPQALERRVKEVYAAIVKKAAGKV
ncbi:MAG TPA: dephospho-CoA kinase [Candidatus Eisenbacteria bacterium]|jgi:dephospho-CoA kinase|nr:dephospho-CoA kinase [Candidatus Eisenbacteria bacterium]